MSELSREIEATGVTADVKKEHIFITLLVSAFTKFAFFQNLGFTYVICLSKGCVCHFSLIYRGGVHPASIIGAPTLYSPLHRGGGWGSRGLAGKLYKNYGKI